MDGAVRALAFSDDFSEGLVATAAATLWHVDLATAHRVPLLSAHAAAVTSFAPSPTDPLLAASTCLDGLLRIWQITSGDVRTPLRGQLASHTHARSSCQSARLRTAALRPHL